MIYSIDEVMSDVRVCLDQNMSSEQLIADGDIDTLAMDEIIRSKIVEATRRVHCQAPVHLLEGGHTFGDAVYWADKGCGWVLLPDDFMRLVMFRMSDWERPVYTAISTGDPEYELQSSRFRGIRGTTQKPVCAIAVRPEGNVLEFYACKNDGAYVKQATYLPYPCIDEDGGIDISERCKDAVVYMAAALVCVTFGEVEKSKVLMELSASA